MKQVGFIGCGNMGGAILQGALESGALQKEQVWVHTLSQSTMDRWAAVGVNVAQSNEEVCQKSDIVFLAVKPQYAAQVLAEVGTALDGKCVISIMAGITTPRLKAMIQGEVRVLRCMPNTPAMVMEGVCAVCEDTDALPEEKELAERMFVPLGLVEWIPERLIDAAGAVSGSGPAYAAMFAEALADGGVMEGLPRAMAYRLAAQTLIGTAKMLMEKGMHPGELKDMVTSPGGTTIEGCLALERGGMRAAVMECVRAGAEKSRKL